MTTGLIDIMKRASKEVFENEQPTDLRFGTVVSESPLKVQVTNLFTLPESMLIVPKHLTDYEVEISLNDTWKTELYNTHTHDIKMNKKKMTVHNALKVGEKVALIRKHGGQSFYILDRI